MTKSCGTSCSSHIEEDAGVQEYHKFKATQRDIVFNEHS